MSRRLRLRARRWPVVLAAALALALLLGACGGSSQFRYVKSSDNTLFFKVPAKWKSFNNQDLVLAEAAVNQQLGKPQSIDDLRTNIALNWRRGFDSSSTPSAVNVVVVNSDQLVVDARVRSLTAEERQNINLDQLRNIVLPIDQLQAQQDEADKGKPPTLTQNKDFSVRVNNEIAKPGGFHGLQTIVNLRATEADNKIYTYNQIALLNADNTKLYLLSIHCETLCYEQNRGTVLQIVKSFTLQKKK
jgi:hypothetical protein